MFTCGNQNCNKVDRVSIFNYEYIFFIIGCKSDVVEVVSFIKIVSTWNVINCLVKF